MLEKLQIVKLSYLHAVLIYLHQSIYNGKHHGYCRMVTGQLVIVIFIPPVSMCSRYYFML